MKAIIKKLSIPMFIFILVATTIDYRKPLIPMGPPPGFIG